MKSQMLTIPARIIRGLLAAVFVVSNLCHGSACCCASRPCGRLQNEARCCNVEAAQGCCCQQSSDNELANSTCCCSKTSQQSSAGCQGTCHCSGSPLTEAVIALPQRIQQEQVQNAWLTDFNPLATNATSIARVERRPGQQFRSDPCAHNLRQAILCVWRN